MECTMSTFLWIILATLYVMALVMLGLTTLRKGHTWLFVFGIFLPFLWIVGALIGPTPRAASAAEARWSLRRPRGGVWRRAGGGGAGARPGALVAPAVGPGRGGGALGAETATERGSGRQRRE